MNRCAVRIGSALALAGAFLAFAGIPASAASATYTFNGQTVTFTQVMQRDGGAAISIDDPALAKVLDQLGATIDYQPGSPYVLLTTAKQVVITFKIGSSTYHSAEISRRATVTPFVSGIHPYVSLTDLLRALDLPTIVAVQPDVSPSPLVIPTEEGPRGTSGTEASATPAPSPIPTAQGPAQITAVDTQSSNGTFTARITVDGNATFQWHRLHPPDNRWWIDIANARLAMAPADQPGAGPVTAVRVHQQGPTTVRIALSLSAFNDVQVSPNATGITLTVANRIAPESVARTGGGSVGQTVSAFAQPSPSGSPYLPANPRLIVIDPGHGGSDPGAIRSGLSEKTVTLDISRRLRQILIARGWQVMMTRDGDSDVYAPNDSATDELQARDDLANQNGARLLVSVHVNSYVNAGPHGVTTYYYKSEDFALARAIDRRASSELAIKDNGVIKDKLYVIHHAQMPAALIETAFLSNPDDRQLLNDPSWRQKMAQAIADGITDYAGSP